MEFAYYFHYCKNLKFEDRPDYSTLKSLFFDLLMQDYTINTEFIFDWFMEPEEEKEEREKMRHKPHFNINDGGDESNIIDLTPMDGTITKKNTLTEKPKKEFYTPQYNQYANTKTAEFNNSPNKSNDAKSGTLLSVPKRRTQSFSESGSSDSSGDEGTLRAKPEDDYKKSKLKLTLSTFL